MMDIRVANAPCSWGALEFEGMGGGIAFRQMLDELRDTGYVGTELGDWGYMPTEPVAPDAMKVARLLAAVANTGAGGQLPLVILADANGTDPLRTQYAGRVTSEMGLSPSEWKTFAGGAERIARAVRNETGLAMAFHHHCGGYVETPEEIANFLDMTNHDLLGLVFDTGHYLYGGSQTSRRTYPARAFQRLPAVHCSTGSHRGLGLFQSGTTRGVL